MCSLNDDRQSPVSERRPSLVSASGWRPRAITVGRATPSQRGGDPVSVSDFHAAIELIGRRWTGAILWALSERPHYFAELTTSVPGLSDRLLSRRLRELESAGLVERSVSERPAGPRLLRPDREGPRAWPGALRVGCLGAGLEVELVALVGDRGLRPRQGRLAQLPVAWISERDPVGDQRGRDHLERAAVRLSCGSDRARLGQGCRRPASTASRYAAITTEPAGGVSQRCSRRAR